MANKDIRLLSGRLKNRAPNDLDSNRDKFLSLDNAEPNLGSPAADNYVLGSSTAANGGTRRWLSTSGAGVEVSNDQLYVDEAGVAINGAPLNQYFNYAGNITLAAFVDDVDSALAAINSTAISGSTVTGDSNFTGAGTVSDPLSLDSTLRIQSITAAQFIRADDIGDSNTSFVGDGSGLFNLPIADSDIDSIARNALEGGRGILYEPSGGAGGKGLISIDSTATDVVFQALTVDSGGLLVRGNLTVEGTQVIIETTNLAVDDPLIHIGKGNETGDVVDLGFVAHYYNGTDSVHTGLFRDADDPNKSYVLFQSLVDPQFDTTSPPTTVNTSGTGFALSPLKVSTIDAYKGDFDSAVINSGNLVVSQGDISAVNGKITADSLDVNIFTLDSGSIGKLRLGTLDSAVGINADSGNITRISFDSIDSDTRSMLQLELVPKDAEGNIDSDQLPDLFLRNDSNDSTTGSITADGGFIGNLDADSADITKLTGDSATFNKLTGRLIGLADSALSADKLTTQRTFQVSGDVTTSSVPTFDGSNNVNMSVSLNAGVVDENELATDAVREAKIQDGAVTASKIAPGAVDSDIRSLITKAYLDSANIDADTLDSLNSTQFLRSDSDDVVTANRITWQNNSQAAFGTSNDLKIYHDGTNSYIKDEGTGDLYITTNGQEVLIKDSVSGKTSAEFIPDSAVDLYYNGSLKFETTNTGAKVTGIIEADSGTLNGARILTTADEGAGNGLNADTLDGLQSTQFLRSDQDDSMAGTLFINDSLSANNITRRNSPVVANTYGSPTQIPIIKVDASGFVDSVGIAAVAGVDSVDFDSASGKFTVFLATNDSLSANITLDPFTTADLTEDSTALYYTDARADSAARSAISISNIIAPGFNTSPYSYGLSYDSNTGIFTFNGIDSGAILAAIGGSSGGGTGGGQTGSQTTLTLAQLFVDSLYAYEKVFIGYDANGNAISNTDVRINEVDIDSAYIRIVSFDSIDSDTKVMLQDELVPKDASGNIDSSQLPDLFLRNDGNDSTTGTITAVGFIGNLDADSADITVLTGDSATFNKLTGSLDGSNLVNTSVSNDKLVNSKITITDGSTPQDVDLGETITFSNGTDIQLVTSATNTVTANNTSTLATVTGRGNTTTNAITVGNFETTGYIRGPSTLTIDPADHDSISGTVRILGDLQVDGTTTTVNSTEVTINDKTLTLADSSASAAVADGAGLIIDGANATWLYKDVSVTGSDSAWVSNINIKAPRFVGNLSADLLDTGEVDSSLLPSYLQTSVDGAIDENVIPDRYLKNNASDSTTGTLTADGGFVGDLTGNVVGNLDADSADITLLTGDSATFTKFTGDLVGNASTADSATTAARWTNARTVTFATGEVTGSFSIDGSGDVANVALTIANDAVDLGGQTTGDYVAGVSAGAGISLSATTGEGFTPTISVNDTYITGLFSGGTGVTITGDSISIGQDVATTADVRFGSVIADSVVSIGETTSRDYLTIGGASTNETFGITFVDPTTATSGAHVSYKDSDNTLILGTVSGSSKTESITVQPTRVGIFNDNPSSTLHVTGTIRSSLAITSDVTGAGGFIGDGRSLTNIDASEVDNRGNGALPNTALNGSYTGITAVGALTQGSIGSGFGNINIPSSSITASGFTGNGSGLTNLPAGQLTGTVDSARLSGPYPGITEVGALSAGSIDSGFGNVNIGTSTFTGDGSGLFNVDAATLNGIDPEEFSRTVVLTDSDTGTGPAGTGYFYKIATYTFTDTTADGTFLYTLMPEETTAAHSGATILSVQVKYGATNHTANVDILSMGGTVPFSDNSFRLIKTASGEYPELWMQSNIAGVRLKVVEVSAHKESVSVSYNDRGSWASSAPSSGSNPAVISNGLAYRGYEVFHSGASIDSATINNPTITGDVTLGTEVQFQDGGVSGNTMLKHGSGDNITTSSPSYHILDTNTSSSVTAGKYIITAQRGSSNHITEVNFITTTNGAGVSATEFGTVYTSAPLFNVEMDVSGGNLRLKVQGTSITQTDYKFSATLFFDA